MSRIIEKTLGNLENSRRPHIVIEPRRKFDFGLRELWSYKDLLFILAGRDIKLRYKQTFLGIIWVVIQPLITAIIFSVVFGGFARLPSDDQPYVLFVFAGLMPWTIFTSSLQRGSGSLVGSAGLISKIYFPRLLIPLAINGAILVDFLVSFSVFIVLMVIYHVDPTWKILTLPFFLLLSLIAAAGVSFWLSALSVYYRDFLYAVPFLIQAWTYASPVVYAMSIVPAQWRWILSINPAVGFIEGFRWALLGSGNLALEMIVVSTTSAFFFFMSGLIVFRRIEHGFADVI